MTEYEYYSISILLTAGGGKSLADNKATPKKIWEILGDSLKTLVVGGTGLYRLEGFEEVARCEIATPLGRPSDVFVIGRIGGKLIAFLPRHSRWHSFSPVEINNPANAFGAKMLGVDNVILVSACGGMSPRMKPGDIVIADELFDMSFNTQSMFHGSGIVCHVGREDFQCKEQSTIFKQAFIKTGTQSKTTHWGGKLINIPNDFASKWESRIFHDVFGAEIIGMTSIAEVMEMLRAEFHTTLINHITDSNVGQEGEEDVNVTAVEAQGAINMEWILSALNHAIPQLGQLQKTCSCGRRLDHCLATDPRGVTAAQAARMRPIIERRLPQLFTT